MKLAIITDTHYGVRNDGEQFLNHFRDFFNDTFFPELERRKIKHVLHLGDLIDRRKFINFKTLDRMYQDFIDPLADKGITMDLIIGNHDVYYRNTNELNGVSLLLRGSKHVNIINNCQTIEYGGCTFACVPWITEDNKKESLAFIKNVQANVLLGHLELQGFAIYLTDTSHKGLTRDLFQKFEKTLLGHFHTRSNQDQVYYLGAPWQNTWIDWGDRKGFHVFDTETRELEFVPNENEMFVKILYDKFTDPGDIEKFDFKACRNKYVRLRLTRDDYNPLNVERFVNRINKENPISVQVVEDMPLTYEDDAVLKDLEDGKIEGGDTKTLIQKAVENTSLSSDIDKNDLTKILITLYEKSSIQS